MAHPNFNEIVEALQITPHLYVHKKVLVARHHSIAYKFITRDMEAFEEYQRFQKKNSFGNCDYIISFVGLPSSGDDATFAGIYKVTARTRSGDIDFRPPSGDPEVIAACAEEQFLYGLVREKRFDNLQFQWDIRWNVPGPAKYQYMHEDFELEVLRFAGNPTVAALKHSLVQQSTDADVSDEVINGSKDYSEGAQYYARHLLRERDPSLIAFVKDTAKKAGLFFCCVCKADFQKLYGVDYIECHHTIPVSTMKSGDKTKVEDVVLLCANCHRAVHKRKPWLEKDRLHELLLNNS